MDVPYVSKLRQAMIILKDSYIAEVIHSLGRADGGFWVIHNPLLNQIKTKLHIQDKTTIIDFLPALQLISHEK